jgi:hypothetical protein
MIYSAMMLTDSGDAGAVCASLNADNLEMENLRVTSEISGSQILTRIESNSIGSLLAAADDLISCQITSESLI